MTPKEKVKVDPNKVIKTEPKLIKENFPKQGKKKFGIGWIFWFLTFKTK